MQHEAQSVDLSVLRELRPDEQLLWWGQPDPRRQVRTNSPLVYILYGILISAISSLLYFFLAQYAEVSQFFPSIFVFFILFVLAILLLLLLIAAYGTYKIYHKIAIDLRHTTYAITDQRIITIVTNQQDFAVTSHTAEDVGMIQLVETDDGWGNVSYGYPHALQVGAVRATIIPTLTGIPHVRMVEDILSRTFKQRGYSAPHVESPPASNFPQM